MKCHGRHSKDVAKRVTGGQVAAGLLRPGRRLPLPGVWVFEKGHPLKKFKLEHFVDIIYALLSCSNGWLTHSLSLCLKSVFLFQMFFDYCSSCKYSDQTPVYFSITDLKPYPISCWVWSPIQLVIECHTCGVLLQYKAVECKLSHVHTFCKRNHFYLLIVHTSLRFASASALLQINGVSPASVSSRAQSQSHPWKDPMGLFLHWWRWVQGVCAF